MMQNGGLDLAGVTKVRLIWKWTHTPSSGEVTPLKVVGRWHVQAFNAWQISTL